MHYEEEDRVSYFIDHRPSFVYRKATLGQLRAEPLLSHRPTGSPLKSKRRRCSMMTRTIKSRWQLTDLWRSLSLCNWKWKSKSHKFRDSLPATQHLQFFRCIMTCLTDRVIQLSSSQMMMDSVAHCMQEDRPSRRLWRPFNPVSIGGNNRLFAGEWL